MCNFFIFFRSLRFWRSTYFWFLERRHVYLFYPKWFRKYHRIFREYVKLNLVRRKLAPRFQHALFLLHPVEMPYGHQVLNQGLKLNSKNSVGKYENNLNSLGLVDFPPGDWAKISRYLFPVKIQIAREASHDLTLMNNCLSL